MINQAIKKRIEALAAQYQELAQKSPNALREIAALELPEMVYNSNAIENSTLTLQDTEDILLHNQIRTDHEIREIYEAKNLAKTMGFLTERAGEPLSVELILELHRILLTDINDRVAGRFRVGDEWVRVGAHLGANPDFVNGLMYDLVRDYRRDQDERHLLEKIAYFHAEFENIHPFCDGNGRIGRLVMNYQLEMAGLPPIIVANKTKTSDYYPLLAEYGKTGDYSRLTDLVAGLTLEALYRRITKLTAKKIVPLADWAKARGLNNQACSNRAARGTLPAFRVSDHWMIDADYQEKKDERAE